ncbi:MAG: DNA replication/repair protein RecF [Clostridia bacterium]|nr:DNA replication/repair protein RecF [Clostridia bacterium]
MMIGQLKPAYVYNLNMYLKFLEQRNNYLKQIKLENKPINMLEIWNEKIIEYAEKIYKYRNEFMNIIKEKINDIHSNITDKKEVIEIEYVSDYENTEDFRKKLHNSEKIDIIRGFTTKGIHKDDFIVKINNKPINVYGSQGQNRTAILSLKICELQVIYEEIGEYPILLLDDFMSELDEKRRKSFLENIKDIQVIITCTQEMNLENDSYSSYLVQRGEIVKCT